MSTVSSVQLQSEATAAPMARPVAAPDLLAQVLVPANGVRIALVTLGVVGLYWRWLWTQGEYSAESGDWSHAFMVPFISIYLMWQHRESLERAPFSTFWPGVVPVLMGIVSYVFFITGVPNHLGQGLSLILTVFGASLLLLGPRAMVWLFLPIGYLVFGITMPEQVMIRITFPLQGLAATGADIMLRVFGIDSELIGHTIQITDSQARVHPLNVAEACSGMRMLIAFLALGAAVALVATGQWWKRVVLLGLALPLAILLNIVRVFALGLVTLVNPDLSTGEAHTFIGTLLLIPGFFVYMLIVWALNKAVPEDGAAGSKP